MEYWARFGGGTYAPDRMIEEAEEFIQDNHAAPFFLVYATPVPHLALQVPEEELAAYEGVFDEEAYLGGSYLPHPRPLSAYAAMITRMDRNIGRLVSLVDELGLGEDTVIMFSSDNGTTYTGGVKADVFDSVAGLRGLKGSVFEGGVRVPMIARWTGQIEAGTVTDQVSAFWDVMPTLADIAGAQSPESIDGESFADALMGAPASPRERPLYWEYHAFGAMQAVRDGNWKAVRLGARETPDGPIQLFDLETDVAESQDVAAEHPEVVARMDSVMNARTLSHLSRWNFGDNFARD